MVTCQTHHTSSHICDNFQGNQISFDAHFQESAVTHLTISIKESYISSGAHLLGLPKYIAQHYNTGTLPINPAPCLSLTTTIPTRRTKRTTMNACDYYELTCIRTSTSYLSFILFFYLSFFLYFDTQCIGYANMELCI
jgi:hypothetical protein